MRNHQRAIGRQLPTIWDQTVLTDARPLSVTIFKYVQCIGNQYYMTILLHAYLLGIGQGYMTCYSMYASVL